MLHNIYSLHFLKPLVNYFPRILISSTEADVWKTRQIYEEIPVTVVCLFHKGASWELKAFNFKNETQVQVLSCEFCRLLTSVYSYLLFWSGARYAKSVLKKAVRRKVFLWTYFSKECQSFLVKFHNFPFETFTF